MAETPTAKVASPKLLPKVVTSSSMSSAPSETRRTSERGTPTVTGTKEPVSAASRERDGVVSVVRNPSVSKEGDRWNSKVELETDKVAIIELRLSDLEQLFNSIDASPFLERDLDDDADSYIRLWAGEAPSHKSLELVVFVEKESKPEIEEGLEDAVQHYFRTQLETQDREIALFFKFTWWNLVMGVICLVIIVTASELLISYADTTTTNLVSQGMFIIAWVLLWRPIQNFLYDWQPLYRARSDLKRLSMMRVVVESQPGRDQLDVYTTKLANGPGAG